jgi:uncharacterized protein YrrD
MRKGSDLIGRPIISFDTGEQFEKIQDLIFDQNNNQLLGFVVDEGGWFSSARVLPLQGIQAIGPDVVIVPDKQAVVAADTEPTFRKILERNNILKGTKIVTTDGKDLGTLVDLYFDEQSGAVEGYEASGGIFADAVNGKSFVPAPHTLKIGEDVAFVPPETAQLMEEQVGGLRAAAQSATDAVTNTAGSVSTAVTNTAVSPDQQKAWVIGRTADRDVMTQDGTLLVAQGQQVTPLAADEAERQGALADLYRATGGSLTVGVSTVLAARAVEQAEGRRVNQMVRTDQGLIIAAPGQIVTEQVINRARTYHKETELMDATGMSTTDAAKQAMSGAGTSISGAAATAGASLRESTQNVKEGAGSLWEKLKTKVSETQETTAREAEEQRIKYAVGRPAARVILDKQDNVILNVGELITHKAVEDARQAGVLDMLLSSVYDKEPELSQAELRAPEPGEASLEQQRDNQIKA